MEITYEVSYNEPIHPDPWVAARFREIQLSSCEHGCKIYGDPLSSVTVLMHNEVYGCRKVVKRLSSQD